MEDADAATTLTLAVAGSDHRLHDRDGRQTAMSAEVPRERTLQEIKEGIDRTRRAWRLSPHWT